MTKLLHLMASPRRGGSASAEVATTYIDALRLADISIEVDVFNVWDEDLPEFGLDESNARYAGVSGMPLTGRQKTA
jgi:FMN-dependent NADH-azoreductase